MNFLTNYAVSCLKSMNLYLILSFSLVSVLLFKILKWFWLRKDFYILSMMLPGPISFPFIGSLPEILNLATKKDHIKRLCTFVQKYPDGIMRFWLGPDLFIFVTEPEDVEAVMKSRTYAKPPRFFNFASKLIGSGILTDTGLDGKWKIHRRIMSSSFNTSILRSHQTILQRHCQIFVEDLQKLVGIGPVDYQTYVGRFVADSVSESLFGYKMNFREGNDDDIIHALDRITEIAFEKIYKVWYYVDFFFNMSDLKKRQVKSSNVLTQFAKRVYENKMKDFAKDRKEGRQNVVHTLLEHRVKDELGENEVLDEIRTIWAAGADTIIGDLCLLLKILAMHKEAQDKVFKEIETLFEGRRDDPVQNDDLNHCPYLDMCIKEVLRLFTVAPINFRYFTEDVVLKHRNLTIPRHVGVGMVLLASHRNPKIWDKPDEFIPERFSPEQSAKRHLYAYYPFSGGNRSCIGQRYGFSFLKTAAVYILRKYELHSTDKLCNMQFYYDINVKPTDGFKIEFSNRIWNSK